MSPLRIEDKRNQNITESFLSFIHKIWAHLIIFSDVSFMERIMKNNQAYQRQANGKFDEKVITKLLKNYRTHPDILKIVSDLFYHKELQVSPYFHFIL